MKRYFLFSIILCCIVALSSCSILQFANLKNCNFAMAGIQNVTWAGINFSNVSSARDLSVTDLAKAMEAIKNLDFKITCDVKVNVENPTNRIARLIGYDYELYLDNKTKPIVTGSSRDKEYLIPANTISVIPIPVKMDLVSMIKHQEIGSIINCIRNIQDKGNGTSSDIKVRFTPYLSMGNNPTRLSPITLTKTFQSSQKETSKAKKQSSTASPNKR